MSRANMPHHECRVHLMQINCAPGLNTPPVGTTQFIGCAIGGISVGEVMRTILPFYAALIAALFAVTYVPAFSMWLPRLLMGCASECIALFNCLRRDLRPHRARPMRRPNQRAK